MEALIEKFYNSFSQLDGEGMVECYHPDIIFKDPAFGVLEGEKAKNMWRMLCENQKGKNFRLSFSNITSRGNTGSAHWEAHYIFSKTGREVHNKIEASFEFKDNKIIKHTDSFNLYSWSIQALGFTGLMVGWTGFFKKKLNKQTNSLLNKYEKNNPLDTLPFPVSQDTINKY